MNNNNNQIDSLLKRGRSEVAIAEAFTHVGVIAARVAAGLLVVGLIVAAKSDFTQRKINKIRNK